MTARPALMGTTIDVIVRTLSRSWLLRRDLDYQLLRSVMVVIFVWFGWDKWHVEEIQGLAPLITHGPLIFWTLPVLGLRGTSILLGASEWAFGALLLLGFRDARLGALGALGSCATFVATVTILPFAPGAWDQAAGGFPSMTIVAAFLLKDLVLLAVSACLLRHDVSRVIAIHWSGHARSVGVPPSTTSRSS